MPKKVSKNLLAWYEKRRKSLPWRDAPEPYRVWVAEIMAQQTRLDTMLPYYDRWVKRFPDINSLAESDEEEVLRMWEGLGYYSRARNLYKAANLLKVEHDGKLPEEVNELKKLPGIGPYSAGAIASIAYGQDEPAVDGNAIRVITRLFDIEKPTEHSATVKLIWRKAKELLPSGHAAEFNQAIMDLGAEICKPRLPKCEQCPINNACIALAKGNQRERPVKKPKSKIPTRFFASAVLLAGGKALVIQRPERGLLGGMWEFPNVEVNSFSSADDQLRRNLFEDFKLRVVIGDRIAELGHTYSHFHAEVQVYLCEVKAGRQPKQKGLIDAWNDIAHLSNLPMGKLDRQIANIVALL